MIFARSHFVNVQDSPMLLWPHRRWQWIWRQRFWRRFRRSRLSVPERVTRTRAREDRVLAFTVIFYGLKDFCCKTAQFCATQRESDFPETPSVSNGAQTGENARKNSLLN